ncbi:MAG: laccase domain-containing protein, partial [Acidimicrobiales bacterium]
MRAWWSDRRHGDQSALPLSRPPAVVPPELAVVRLRQVHGARVVAVGEPASGGPAPWSADPDGAPPEADAVVAPGPGSCLVVLTADCAPVALGSPEGVHGAVHVGWRGLCRG